MYLCRHGDPRITYIPTSYTNYPLILRVTPATETRLTALIVRVFVDFFFFLGKFESKGVKKPVGRCTSKTVSFKNNNNMLHKNNS